MSGLGLTSRQRELLAYIGERDICPTFQEMADALGLGSKHSVFLLVNQLERRGRIRRLKNRVRSIEVLTPAKPTTYTARGQRFLFIPRMG